MAQRRLREKRRVDERLLDDALSQPRDSLGDFAHTLFVFCRQEEWPQKWAVDAVAERQPFGAHACVHFRAECRAEFNIRAQQPVPNAGWRRRRAHCVCRLAHAFLASAFCRDGAPVKPAAAPMPTISSHRGHGFAGLPLRARSITRRAMRSTTCSK